jgi:hypothetical protein
MEQDTEHCPYDKTLLLVDEDIDENGSHVFFYCMGIPVHTFGAIHPCPGQKADITEYIPDFSEVE